MRKPVLLILINACILILVFVLLGQSLFIVHRVALARQVSGQVTVQRSGAGAWEPLEAGATIKRGDVVRTKAKSWAEFGWQNGTRWRLAPESSLVIEKALLNPNKNNEIAQFRLESGEVLVRVAGTLAPTSRFEIETPNAIAAVTGTVFSTAFQRGQTEVKVFQGTVDVYDSNRVKKTSLTPGRTAQVSLLRFQTISDANQSDFLAQPAFLKPELQGSARALTSDTALVSGQTEVGDVVTIDGASVPVLGTGHFARRVKIGAGKTGWTIESTDKYGAKTTVWQTLPTYCP